MRLKKTARLVGCQAGHNHRFPAWMPWWLCERLARRCLGATASPRSGRPDFSDAVGVMRGARYGDSIDTYTWDGMVEACSRALLDAGFDIRRTDA